MSTHFEKYIAKGNDFLSLLKDDLRVNDDTALRIFKCVLHTIRAHVSLQESLQIIAQLPMIIKAIYVDQWNYTAQVTGLHHLQDFLTEIQACDKELATSDFGSEEAVSNAAKAVFRTLHYYLSEGEMEDIIAVMPTQIKRFIIDTIGTGRMAM